MRIKVIGLPHCQNNVLESNTNLDYRQNLRYLIEQRNLLDAQIQNAQVESICGGDNTQGVESYSATLGVDKSFVDNHEQPVGQLQWLNNLDTVFSGSEESPGNVSDLRWASGALISNDLFLTAGHVFNSSDRDWRTRGWEAPSRNGRTVPPEEIATLMKVNFNYQRNGSTNRIRTAESFSVIELVEHSFGVLDFAIVRLGENEAGELPGQKFGKLTLASRDLTEENSILCIIQHPNGDLKRVGIGRMNSNQRGRIKYKIDTSGASSGAPIISVDGEIVGVHTDGLCDSAGNGFNFGTSIGAIRSVSSTVVSLSDSVASSRSSTPENTSTDKKFITMRHTKNTKRIIDIAQEKLQQISSQEIDFRVVGEEVALLANTIESTSQLPELKTKDFKDPGKEIPFVEIDQVLDTASIRERIIDESDLLPIYFLEEGVRVQNSVARIVLSQTHIVNGRAFRPGTGWATGFLVAPSLFLTNNHVIPDEGFANKIRIQFNYQLSADGMEQSTDYYYPSPEDFFYTNPSLDFTLIRLRSKSVINDPIFGSGTIAPGQRWSFIQLNPDPVYLEDQHLNIIQHPSGRRKQIALQNNQIANLYQDFIRYTTDTEPGSSGSPVFDNLWQIVALHHAGGKQDVDGRWINNQGVRIDSIVNDLRGKLLGTSNSSLLDELSI